MPSVMTLKKSNCKNCYKCIRYCPVKAIRFSGNQAHIIEEACILCGHCFVVCPQDAKQIVSDREKVRVLLQSGVPVVASIAPSFVANYKNVGIESMRSALKKLGFYDVEETAVGATLVKREYERILREEQRDVLISSCCHSINLLIQKHFPAALEYLADVMSPMQAHCMDIKKRIPNAKVVFIGPCLAKKDEAERYRDITDAVLTFDELSAWLQEEGIGLLQQQETQKNGRARFFPTTGGILKTFSEQTPGYTYLAIDGVDNCIHALHDIVQGNVHKCFIEMSACVGSCIGGPVMEKNNRSHVTGYAQVAGYAGSEDFDVAQPAAATLHKTMPYIQRELIIPTEQQITQTLHTMGKFSPEQELNCGSCGYNTCRDKAIAVCQGKAEISMCLPFLKEKAESFSDTIVKNTHNGLIVLNEELEVQQINAAACKIMNIRSAADILGDQVIRILDPTPFLMVKQTGKDVINKPAYLAEYRRYVEQTIIYDRESRLLIGIMRDVTDEQMQRQKKEEISHQTIAVADRVVDKQMRIVQEIASLLGETAAETKIALAKLKEFIADE